MNLFHMFLNILHLKKGDIIFTGTPEGVSSVKPNDVY
jgi:2-keto-4-pentenoate hydratase/2-oxohepta-3-ene-1,7-dioic acid hydratase in catechol pathway